MTFSGKTMRLKHKLNCDTTYMINTSRFFYGIYALWWKIFDSQVKNLTLFGLFENRQWSTMMTCKCDDFSGSKHLKQSKSVSKKLQWNYSCLSPPTIIGNLVFADFCKYELRNRNTCEDTQMFYYSLWTENDVEKQTSKTDKWLSRVVSRA